VPAGVYSATVAWYSGWTTKRKILGRRPAPSGADAHPGDGDERQRQDREDGERRGDAVLDGEPVGQLPADVLADDADEQQAGVEVVLR